LNQHTEKAMENENEKEESSSWEIQETQQSAWVNNNLNLCEKAANSSPCRVV